MLRTAFFYFIWPLGENREKSRDMFRPARRDESWSRVAFTSVRRWTFRGRRSHARNVYVPRKSATAGGGRDGGGGCARDEVEDGIGIANIPLLRLTSLADLSLRSTIDRPPARSDPGTYTRCISPSMFQRIFSLDDKSPDFTGFKFVTALNCDASVRRSSYVILKKNIFEDGPKSLISCRFNAQIVYLYSSSK